MRLRNIRARYVYQILVALAVDQLLLEDAGGLTVRRLWRRFEVLELFSSRAVNDRARETARINAVEWSCFQNLVDFFGSQVWWHAYDLRSFIYRVLSPHYALVTFLTRHKLGNHGTILLVNCRFVGVSTSDGTFLPRVLAILFQRPRYLRQLDLSASPVVVGTYFALHVAVR